MSDLRDLYQEVILDHYKHPRNHGEVDACSAKADGFNPLCGDRVTVALDVEDDRIVSLRFVGSGCAISMASASMMTEAARGKTRAEAEALLEHFRKLVMGDDQAAGPDLGKLQVFAGVREYPARVKCATLAWHTLKNALTGSDQTAKTE